MVKDEDFGNDDPKSVLCKFCFLDMAHDAEQILNIDPDRGKALPSINDLDDIEF